MVMMIIKTLKNKLSFPICYFGFEDNNDIYAKISNKKV